jgi:putative oxidoreductase
MFGGEPAIILTPSWFLGNIELVASIALGIGFLTRPFAIVVAVDMLIVYLTQYLPRGLPPLGANLGEQFVELAIVSAFLAFAGPGRFSVDTDLKRQYPDAVAPALGEGLSKYYPQALAVNRILMALLFADHGLSKLGITDEAEEFMSQAWIAGVVEVFGGAALALGLFTRPIAFIASGQMAFAYFLSHAPRAFAPIVNNGDRPATYCFFFLFLAAAGPGLWALDRLRERRQVSSV